MKTMLHMIVTLVVVGLLSGGALSVVNQATAPRIAEQERLAREAAVLQVFPGGATAAPLIADRAAQIAAGADPATLPDAYRVLDAGGQELGLAVMGQGIGFADVIKLVLGVSRDASEIRGLHVIKDSETPGLGTKIRPGAEFPQQFRELADGGHLQPPLKVVKGKRTAPNEVEAITAATISSKAVTTIVNETVVSLRAYLAAHPEGGGL
jgi:Na+-translocating ferredoxin:NAD+ oxidoreductase subunit G